jgi:hypothetical protein
MLCKFLSITLAATSGNKAIGALAREGSLDGYVLQLLCIVLVMAKHPVSCKYLCETSIFMHVADIAVNALVAMEEADWPVALDPDTVKEPRVISTGVLFSRTCEIFSCVFSPETTWLVIHPYKQGAESFQSQIDGVHGALAAIMAGSSGLSQSDVFRRANMIFCALNGWMRCAGPLC